MNGRFLYDVSGDVAYQLLWQKIYSLNYFMTVKCAPAYNSIIYDPAADNWHRITNAFRFLKDLNLLAKVDD